MGIFGKIFGGKKEEYPALDSASPTTQQIEKFRPQLEKLAGKIDDRFEAVPADKALFVFIGNPPGMFGMDWFIEGDAEEHNLKKLIAKKGLSQRKIDNLLNKLRTAYTEKQSDQRFSTTIGGKQFIVTPSPALAENLHNILHFMDE